MKYSGSAPITVTGTVTLCLNGHVLDLNGKSIMVKNGAHLTLCDCNSSTTTTGCIGSDGLWHAGSSNDDTPCNLTGGVINGGGGCDDILVN